MRLHEVTQLDESHPMTRMMMRAYGMDKSETEKTTVKGKANKKGKCRGCGDEKVLMKGLCKQCAEDTYADRD